MPSRTRGCWTRRSPPSAGHLELKPDFVEHSITWACALQKLGKLDEAIACFRRALELRPGLCCGAQQLGRRLGGLGKTGRGRLRWRRAVELKPRLCPGAQQPGQCLAGPTGTDSGSAGRSGGLLPPGPGTATGLCRGTRQPGRRPEGSGKIGRSRRLLPPGLGTRSRTPPRPTTTWATPAEPGKGRRSGRLLPPRPGAQAGLCRGASNLGDVCCETRASRTKRPPATAAPWS